MALLAVGAGLSVVHGATWDTMSDEARAQESAIMMPTPEQANEQLQAMFGSYAEVVANHAPATFMFETMYFTVFFLWRCSGMMLLGMALYKWGFLDGRRGLQTYMRTAAIAIPVGLALAWYGTAELERIRFTMPERAICRSLELRRGGHRISWLRGRTHLAGEAGRSERPPPIARRRRPDGPLQLSVS